MPKEEYLRFDCRDYYLRLARPEGNILETWTSDMWKEQGWSAYDYMSPLAEGVSGCRTVDISSASSSYKGGDKE